MEETITAGLESSIDALIALCTYLTRENHALHERQAAWQAERATLIERNELAHGKIDAMIGRLRSLDEPLAGGSSEMAATSVAPVASGGHDSRDANDPGHPASASAFELRRTT